MVKIITDSASDISEEMSRELDVTVLPLSVSFGEEQYVDFEELTPQGFVEKVKSSKEHPKTSMVSPERIEDAFKKFSSEYDEVLYIAVSDKISGTYGLAHMICERLKQEGILNITVHNSKTFSVCQCMFVRAAVLMARAGKKAEEICAKIDELLKKQRSIFTLPDLSFVRRGGRLSAGAALIGGILNIMPVLRIEDGIPVQAGRERGFNKIIERMLSIMAEEVMDKMSEVWFIGCDAKNSLATLQKKVTERFAPGQMFVCQALATIGTHGGPGLFGVTWQEV